jgi:uncharacterized protein with gpF-like domain
MVTREFIDAWLKQQSASERSFARALRRFFREQAVRIAEAAADVQGLSPAHVGLIFSPDAEHQRFMPLVRRNLAELMVSGAKSFLQQQERRRRRARKDAVDPFDSEYMERFDLDASDIRDAFWESVPPAIRQRIRHAVDESTSQPYWAKIQDGVQGDIGEIIKNGVDDGLTVQEMAKRIADELEDDSIDRALNIATTESTGGLNAGHTLAIEDAAEGGDGQIVGRQWLAIGDESTRETHIEANNQIVPIGQPFIVGGYEADYPGDDSLPPEERCRCRCTTIAAFADDQGVGE